MQSIAYVTQCCGARSRSAVALSSWSFAFPTLNRRSEFWLRPLNTASQTVELGDVTSRRVNVLYKNPLRRVQICGISLKLSAFLTARIRILHPIRTEIHSDCNITNLATVFRPRASLGVLVKKPRWHIYSLIELWSNFVRRLTDVVRKLQFLRSRERAVSVTSIWPNYCTSGDVKAVQTH